MIVADLAERGLLLNKPGETAAPPVPALLALQEPDHLPRHPAVVRAPGRRRRRDVAAPRGARRDRRARSWIPAWGREPHPRHDRGAPRLVPVAPARLGRADPGVLLHGVRDAICSTPTVIEHVADIFEREGSNAWFKRDAGRAAARAAPRRARAAAGEFEKQHDIVDVWFESGVSWAAVAEGKLVADGREGRPLPRGLRPAPRLVPLVAADRGGDARPGALQGGADPRLGARRARQGLLEVGDRQGPRRPAPRSTTSTPRSGWRRTAPSCCGCGPPRPTTRATSSSRRRSSSQLGESYRKIRNTCRYLLSNLYDFVPSRDRLEDHELRELDLLALGVLRERDHQVFDGYRRYAFHEVVRLMNDYVHHACRPSTSTRSRTRSTARRPTSRARRSVQTAIYEMIRTIAALDGAGPLLHGAGRGRRAGRADRRAVRRARRGARWSTRARSWATRTSAGPTRSGRAARRSCARWRRSAPPATSRWRRACGSRPTAAERPHWQWSLAHLAELCVVSRVELDPADAPAGARPAITVDEAPGPTCPRCWRRTGESAGAGAADPDSVPALRRRDGRASNVERRRQRDRHDTRAPRRHPPPRRKYLLFTIFALVSLVLDQWTKVLRAPGPAPARLATTPRSSSTATSTCATPRTRASRSACCRTCPGGRVVLTLLAVGGVRAGAVLPAQDDDAREHAPAHRAGPGRRRRDRQPDRPRALRQGHRLHRLEGGQRHEWPAFNIADAALCIGVGLMVLDMFIDPRAQAAQQVQAGAEADRDRREASCSPSCSRCGSADAKSGFTATAC